MRRVTWAEIEEFEKDFTHKVLANPDYRYGQAFLKYFLWVYNSMNNDGDLGRRDLMQVWHSASRAEVLDLVDWYIEDNE